MEEAKWSCQDDKNCTFIYDLGCGSKGQYHLCTEGEIKQSEDSCIHEKIIIGKFWVGIIFDYQFALY